MANQFPDQVGGVDVISDAENIKKLLAIPFSESHVSMIVHRVGRTLLIDDFDISSIAMREDNKEWRWLKKFLYDHISMKQSKLAMIPRKDTSRQKLQLLSMFNKFLHHSVAESFDENLSRRSEPEPQLSSARPANLSSSPETNHSLSPPRHVLPSASSRDLMVSPNKSQHAPSPQRSSREHTPSLDLTSDFVERQLNHIDNIYGAQGSNSASSSYLRNLLWQFEDIQMLVGSDMPIFGDSSHPAVSLRLRDMTRPINVLTGLDYWLDNLMCSVPEVVMCYHLDGIVQKYELIKTDDIPFQSGSQFSPNVVRNIAQNILTFLKSKATKSGHTYWLFKGKNDDVVKLYDLSSLCFEANGSTGGETNIDEDDESNPYLIPVAMLLYRVAKNLKESCLSRNVQKANTVYRLLANCLRLIKQDVTKHYRIEQVAINAHFLLADLLVPEDMPSIGSEPEVMSATQTQYTAGAGEANKFPFDDAFDYEDYSGDSFPNSDDESVSSLPVNMLTDAPTGYYNDARLGKQGKPAATATEEVEPLQHKGSLQRVNEALQHVLTGLEMLDLRGDTLNENISTGRSAARGDEDEPKFAKPFEPIPMSFTPLDGDKSDKSLVVKVECDATGREVVPSADKNGHLTFHWKESQQILFLEKTAHLMSMLVELAIKEDRHQDALQYIRLGLMCCEAAQKLRASHLLAAASNRWLATLLALAGDLHLTARNNTATLVKETLNEKRFEERIATLIENVAPEVIEEHAWVYSTKISFERSVEERLKLSMRCFEEAIASLKNRKCPEILKKMGNVCNELGSLYMGQAMKTFNEAQVADVNMYSKLEVQTKKSLAGFVKGIQAFDAVSDSVNCGLLYSNTGKLMRICAHVFAPVDSNKERCKEFSAKERHFYNKSIHYYELAYQKLAQVKDSVAQLWDSLNWDLSTTLFTLGCLLQDFAPLSQKSYEEVEKEIITAMQRAHKLCEKFVEEKERSAGGKDADDARICLYKYRAASIKNRLGSLYHHSFRNMAEGDAKRKQMFQLSDNCYQCAAEGYLQLGAISKEFLESQLERIGIHEHMLTSLSGFSSRLKAYEALFRILESTRPMLSAIVDEELLKGESKTSEAGEKKASSIQSTATVGEDEIDEEEMTKLLLLLHQRLLVCARGLIKTLSLKARKYKSALGALSELIGKAGEDLEREAKASNTTTMMVPLAKVFSAYCDTIGAVFTNA